MTKLMAIAFLAVMGSLALAADDFQGVQQDFSSADGQKLVRSRTPSGGYSPALSGQHRPIRNPTILSRVMWIDRNHEFAIAEDVTVTPDGSLVFAGWWLNHMRFAAYTSAGLENPLWRYYQQTNWQMPVAASNSQFSGTGQGMPAFIWEHDSPLFVDHFDFEARHTGGGVSFSGNGDLLAIVSANGQVDGILAIYDIAAQDTIFTRHFTPVNGLYGVDLSRDGNVAVVSSYGQLDVFEVPSGNYRGGLYNYSQGTAQTSADGSRIANGTFTGGVYLYEWSGTEYTTRWIRATGHDWVTAIDISDDGSTVACGTMDFVGNDYGGKFEMWDGNTGDVLINYLEYGDMVASVDLSATGQYAIAGCWGKYGTTFGDVVTCFIRNTEIPIFQLQDDLDEPGSVFSVAISDSGHFAAAGGKAVHAREFGNGGMLYSIQIRDPLANDVAVASIDEPGEFMAPDETATPTATYINIGTQTASFATACTVINLENSQVVYTGTFTLNNLPSFQTMQVFYPPFTLPADGRYRMFFTANLAGDMDHANDRLDLILRSWHDLAARSIESPFSEVTVNWDLAPAATFKNMGSYAETVDIILSIEDSLGIEIHADTASVFDMMPYAQETVQFDGWAPSAKGLHRAIFTAIVPGDRNTGDNTIEKEFHAVEEMIYDDGVADVAIWVNAYPSSSNRKFAQRFEPNVATPATVTNFRLFLADVAYTGTFDYISITPEEFGLPDTSNNLSIIENPSLPGQNSWAEYQPYTRLFSADPLWVVIHWADTPDNGPFIGADNTGAMDSSSYWYADGEGWHLYPWYDWMIRMTLAEGVGVESDYYSGLPRRLTLQPNYPNPFNPSTTLRFGLPNAGWVRLEIFDMLGRKVRTLEDKFFEAGYHSAVWDGRDDQGREVSSGVYYHRLSAEGVRVSRKMSMVK